MKTNVSIELSDEQRRHLADQIDGRTTKRLATRAEVVALCRLFVEHVLMQQEASEPWTPAPRPPALRPPGAEQTAAEAARKIVSVTVAEEEDRDVLHGKSPGYVRGWDSVKHRLRRGSQA